VRFAGRAWRAHDPKWSFSPLAGAGAAQTGGRFNRKGQAALYLALDLATAVAEAAQGFGQRIPPLTLCEYDVDCEEIAGLSDEATRAPLGVTAGDIACAWLTFQLAGKRAPSQLVAQRLKAEGYAGLLAPSFAPGASGTNLVLWAWGPAAPHKVEVYDPDGRLPRDRRSWTAEGAS